jgi:flagellar motor protein MotB
MIEGHTDSAPIAGGDNLDLSAERSARIFRLFEQDAFELSNFKNKSGKPVLSVSGYGETRPANEADPRADENRRIDIRFIMELPKETAAAEPPPVTETRQELSQ